MVTPTLRNTRRKSKALMPTLPKVNIPPFATINTTTLQQTIISSLNPVSVRIWEQERKALENAGVNNPLSHRLADPVLAILASIALSNPEWWPEVMTIRLLQPLTKYNNRELLNVIIDTHATSVMRTLREMYLQEKRKGSAFLEAQSLLPPSKMCSEAVIHDWGDTFQGYIDTGKFSEEEARQVIDAHRKLFPKKIRTTIGFGERCTQRVRVRVRVRFQLRTRPTRGIHDLSGTNSCRGEACSKQRKIGLQHVH